MAVVSRIRPAVDPPVDREAARRALPADPSGPGPRAQHEGLAALVGALQAWCTAPSPGVRRGLATALRRFAHGRGVAGIHL